MSKKLDANQVQQLVADAGKSVALAPDELRKLIERIKDMLPEPEEEEKPPATKKQFVILVSDPLRQMPAGVDFCGWVLQIPEEDSPLSTEDRIHRAAYDFNASRRGRKLPVQTIGETLESVPAKSLKEVELWCKTKHPVLLVVTRNEIPNTPGLFGDDERGIAPSNQTVNALEQRIEDIIDWAKNAERIGYSSAQRHFKISYNAACAMIETLEKCGYIRKNEADKYEFINGSDGKEAA